MGSDSSLLPMQTSSGGQLGLGNEFDYWRPTVIDTLQDEEGRTLASLKLECLASLLWNESYSRNCSCVMQHSDKPLF